MWTIRQEQLASLDHSALDAFEGEMVRHLQAFASRLSKVVGEPGLRRAVRLGIERAGRYGLTFRGPVRLYLEAMVLFGAGFDTDPLFPWAGATLRDEEQYPDQMDRAHRLYERMMGSIDHTFGPDEEHAIAALRRFNAERLEEIPDGCDVESFALERLEAAYPQRFFEAGEPAVRVLVRRGMEEARGRSTGGVASKMGLALFIALPFSIGHGYASDPFYPWIARTLDDPKIADPDARIERLYNRSRTYLRESLAHFEQR